MNSQSVTCPLCGKQARLITVRHELIVGRRKVEVDDEYMECGECNETFYTPDQSARLHELTQRAVEQRENLLRPDEIARIRHSFDLTQDEFDDLLGVGAKSSARWESGRVRQNVATDRLIRLLAAERRNVQILAGINGIALRDSCFVPESVHVFSGVDWQSTPDFPDHPPYVIDLPGARENNVEAKATLMVPAFSRGARKLQ